MWTALSLRNTHSPTNNPPRTSLGKSITNPRSFPPVLYRRPGVIGTPTPLSNSSSLWMRSSQWIHEKLRQEKEREGTQRSVERGQQMQSATDRPHPPVKATITTIIFRIHPCCFLLIMIKSAAILWFWTAGKPQGPSAGEGRLACKSWEGGQIKKSLNMRENARLYARKGKNECVCWGGFRGDIKNF